MESYLYDEEPDEDDEDYENWWFEESQRRRRKSLREVTVKRTELLEKVKANRAKHQETFDLGVEVYRDRMVEELDRMLADAKAGRKISRMVSIPEPENHIKDYDTVIMMLEMSVDDEIALDATSFHQYVMDQWQWNASFSATTAMYAASNKRSQ